MMQNNCDSYIYNELIVSSSLEDFSERILTIVKSLGFTDFLFIRINRNWHSHTNQGLLYSLSDEWLNAYQLAGFFEYDLMLSYAKVNSQPIFSSQIVRYIETAPFEILLTHKTRALIDLYESYGFFDHYCIPSLASNGSGCVMLQISTRGATHDQLRSNVAQHMLDLGSLCRVIDQVSTEKFTDLFIGSTDKPIQLAEKSLRSLRLLARSDFSINELANLLCVSPITAHHYVAEARRALGVKTNIAAIIKAVKLGLIILD